MLTTPLRVTLRQSRGLTTLPPLISSTPGNIHIANPSTTTTHTKQDLADAAGRIAASLGNGSAPRMALLSRPNLGFVAGMVGGWMGGHSVVPICTSHPPPEIQHVIDDAAPSTLVVDHALLPALDGVSLPPNLTTLVLPESGLLPGGEQGAPVDVGEGDEALVVYTSGTTGKPKGVVHTHGALGSGVRMLLDAWEWSEEDAIYNVLPLHHVHGLVNVVMCALASGADLVLDPQGFHPKRIVDAIVGPEFDLSLLMGVPTVYTKIHEYLASSCSPEERAAFLEKASDMRLHVCGSAALPVPTLEAWKSVSGHTLLERYGMTEFVMALSNPLDVEGRRPGWVGNPLPGVEIDIIDLADDSDEGGQLVVKSPAMFDRYLNLPEVTASEFTKDGWFLTGDQAKRDPETGEIAILGRISTDILKVSGYKISALEIERAILSLNLQGVGDVAVIGVPDDVKGERIVAFVEGNKGGECLSLSSALESQIAAYKVPDEVVSVSALPRNTQGKVLKKVLLTQYHDDDDE